MRRWSAWPPKSQSQISRSAPSAGETGSFHCVAQAPTVESLGFQVFSARRVERPVLPALVSPTIRTLALVYWVWAIYAGWVAESFTSHTRITPF